MTEEEIKAFFATLERAYNDHDVDGIASHYAEDCVVESPTAGVVVGRRAIESVTRPLLGAFPDLKVETDELLTVGDRIVQTGTSSGTDTGGFVGLPPTGRPFRIGVACSAMPGSKRPASSSIRTTCSWSSATASRKR